MLKILALFGAMLIALLLAGVMGLYFYVWPTGIHDQTLAITPKIIGRLQELKNERKFDPDTSTFYPGAMDEPSRAHAQAVVDGVIDSLIIKLPNQPRKSVVLQTFKDALPTLQTSESEERDQLLVYLERIMSIVGVGDSGELLNVWRYGFPYGWFVSN